MWSDSCLENAAALLQHEVSAPENVFEGTKHIFEESTSAKTDIIVETPNGPDAQKKDIAWIKRRLKKWTIYQIISLLMMVLHF